MHLEELGRIDLPHDGAGDYDHADVHRSTGRVFLANTELGQVEVLDGLGGRHLASIFGCPGASGVALAGERVVAAARESGEVLVIDPGTAEVVSRFAVGPAPNGLAWDHSRGQLLVADTSDFTAGVFDLDHGRKIAERRLPGRPRWAAYDAARDAFYVNVLHPAVVAVLSGRDLDLTATVEIGAAGPHGLGIDAAAETMLVACDDNTLVWVGLDDWRPRRCSVLGGSPDVVWVDSTRRVAYIAVGDPGMLHFYDLDSGDELVRIPTGRGAKTVALDEERNRLYVFLPQTGHAAVYSLVGPP